MRQALKPLYRRWWQRAARARQARLAAGGADGPVQPGFAVLCLPAIDWELRFQRPQQLLSRLALAGHPVLYLRTDFGRGSALGPFEPLAPNVRGLRLPGPDALSLYAAPPDSALVAGWVDLLEAATRAEGLAECVVLVQAPFWAGLALALRERLGWRVVYDCLDDHAGFASNAPGVLAGEEALIAQSDLVLVTARRLEARCAPLARRCLRLPNAADVDHFVEAAPQSTALPRPVIGYYGALAEWFAADWVAAAAKAHPEWSFVLIGLNSGVDLRALERLRNVHLLGERPYADLPAWLHAFDAAMIPFRVTVLTEATDPVKFYEYLAAGKPVVATALPELAPHAALHYPAASAEQFVRQLEAAVAERDPAQRAARATFARANAWPARVAALKEAISALYGEVVIVVVSYNNLAYLRTCLESVWAHTEYPRYRVVVVDNASGPEVTSYLREQAAREPRLQVIFNAENVGFARANNQGLAAAGGAEYVVLLNDDTVVAPGWLSRLVARLRAEPKLGLVGPLTSWSSVPDQVQAGCERLEQVAGFGVELAAAPRGPVRPVPRLDMFCVALRRAVVEEVGPLDEAYGLGMFEDDDYALRLSRAGYTLGVAPEVYVHHWGWSSFGRLDQAEYDRIFETNRKYFEAKWGERWERLPRPAAQP